MTIKLRAESKINVHTDQFQTSLLKIINQKLNRKRPGSSADPGKQASLLSSNQVILTFNTAATNICSYPSSINPLIDSAIYTL